MHSRFTHAFIYMLHQDYIRTLSIATMIISLTNYEMRAALTLLNIEIEGDQVGACLWFLGGNRGC